MDPSAFARVRVALVCAPRQALGDITGSTLYTGATMRARKATGDANVPAGELTWVADLSPAGLVPAPDFAGVVGFGHDFHGRQQGYNLEAICAG